MIRAARLILLGVALASWPGVGVAVAGALVEGHLFHFAT